MKVINENFMKDYEVLTEASLNRLVNGHNIDGYVILSASRHDALDGKVENPSSQEIEDENNKRNRSLARDIRKLHYSYIPVFGGYKEANMDKAIIEKSYVVFPYAVQLDTKTNVEPVDFTVFEKNMKELGDKYNQDSILIKRPESNPFYFYLKTKEADDEFEGMTLKDAAQIYFTSLKKWKDHSLNKSNHDFGEYPQRFSYQYDKNPNTSEVAVESYINRPPMSIMEAHRRSVNGELIDMSHYTK